jgi:ankyrin repeat protein
MAARRCMSPPIRSHDAAVLALAEAGGDPNLLERDRYDIITIAAVADDAQMVATAVKAGGSAANITSIYDGTALIAAAHEGNWESVDVLIKAGAPAGSRQQPRLDGDDRGGGAG